MGVRFSVLGKKSRDYGGLRPAMKVRPFPEAFDEHAIGDHYLKDPVYSAAR